jgi:ATP-dependent exoDNAse (exonuclease V) alpha subunit
VDVIHQHFRYIKRSKGHSVVAAAAYCSGERLRNKYDGKIYDYTKKNDIVYTHILLPHNAPRFYLNREDLWNAVEKGEKNNRAQLARIFDVALPKELIREKQIKLILSYVKKIYVDKGMCADIAVHDKGDGNPHAHVILTLRSINGNGEWMGKLKKNYILDKNGKKIYDPIKRQYKCGRSIPLNDWNDKSNAEIWRQKWADACNKAFIEEGLDKRVIHKSYARQGIDREPTKYLGHWGKALAERGIMTDRNIENKAIITRNIEKDKREHQRKMDKNRIRNYEWSR